MIDIKNISFTYPNGNKAISDLSIHVKKGETVAVVGANGAGKSTLFMMLVGIIFANNGHITVDKVNVSKKVLNELRSKIGIVFQNPDEQLFLTRVYDDIAFGPRNYKVEEKEIERRVNLILKDLNILDLKDRMPSSLSSGEKRMVAIASVLSMNPSILLLDEPTSFLDPRARRLFINTIKKPPHTKLIATHDLDMVLDVCNRVVVLKKGNIVADGKPYDILLKEDLLKNCGLELPISYQKK